MKREGLTAKQIEHAKADPAKRVEIPVGNPPGLFVAVQPTTGAKSWALRYRWRGRPAKLTLGTYPAMGLAAARADAEAKLAALRDGIDPAAAKAEEKAAEPNSAEAVAEEWLTRAVAGTRSAHPVERIVRRRILPAIKGRLITEVSRADVLRVADSIMDERLPVAANRAVSIFKRFLNWSVNRGYIVASPAAGISRPAHEKSRDRVLSDDELRDVWSGASALGFPDGPFFQLLVLTAQRRGEVAGMRWQDLDLDHALWTLSAEQTKAGRVHDVPLSSAALEIIEVLPRFEGPFVFTSGSGAKPINSFSKGKVALDVAVAKLRKDAGETKPMPSYTIHDLRRTASTHMAKAGVAPHVLSALLNHSPGAQQGVTAIYNRFRYLDERRAALEGWGKEVVRLAKQKRKTRAA